MPRDSQYVEQVVPFEDEGMRLDSFVGSFKELDSRTQAIKLIEDGLVLVDGKLSTKSHRVRVGETISVEILPTADTALMPEYIPLDIRYEDSHLMVISKQADLVVHPAEGNWTGTLVHGLLHHSPTLGSLQGEERPGIVHRLDKDTTGLMMVAKSDAAQIKLQEDIKYKNVDRRYLALVHGWIGPETGLIDAPIARDVNQRLKMCVSDRSGSKQAVTSFTVLERFDAGRFDEGYTLIECKLSTGRTHQIRVHMDYIRHPIVGDQTYGSRKEQASRGLNRQFLHSYSLKFNHPITDEPLDFLEPLPDDLSELYQEIKPYSVGRTEQGERIVSQLECIERQREERTDSWQ